MQIHQPRFAGAPSAPPEVRFHRSSPSDGGWRILHAISQQRDERGSGPAEPSADVRQGSRSLPVARGEHGSMEPSNLSLFSRSLYFTAAIAATVLGVALLLVYLLVTVADDPLLARQIGWILLFIGLSAGALAAGAAWGVVRRVNPPLSRVAS